MWSSLDAIAANLALAMNTLGFLAQRLGVLQVLVNATVAHLVMVAHAQRAAVHLHADTGGSKVGVMALLDQLALVHLSVGRMPQQPDGRSPLFCDIEDKVLRRVAVMMG
jgi:hypothetical protein